MKKRTLFCLLALLIFLSAMPVSAANSSPPPVGTVTFFIETVVRYVIPTQYRDPRVVSHLILEVPAYPATFEIYLDGQLWATFNTEDDEIGNTARVTSTEPGTYYVRLLSVQGQYVDQPLVRLGSFDGRGSPSFGAFLSIDRDAIRYNDRWWSTCTLPDHVRPPTTNNNSTTEVPSLHVLGAPPGGHPTAIVNGNVLTVTPIMRNNRTLVPLRAIAEAFGVEVSWQGELQQITIYTPSGNVYLTVGNTTVRGADIVLDVAPIVENGVTFMPARFFAYLFDAEVSFEPYGG